MGKRLYFSKRRAAHASHALAIALFALISPVHASAAPKRVVSTFLCTDEYVFRLVDRKNIAALSILAGDNPPVPPVVSTIAGKVKGTPLIQPSAETILVRNPDLVVIYEGTNPRMRTLLLKAGVPIVDVPWAASLADIRKVTKMLGRALGVQQRAGALIADMDAHLAKIKAGAVQTPVRTLIYEPNGYATTGGIARELMNAAGLADIAPSLGMTRLSTIPVEAVIAGGPELLILNGASRSVRTRADLVLHHPALKALDGHALIASADLTPLLCPGPWSVDAGDVFVTLGHKASALASHRPRS